MDGARPRGIGDLSAPEAVRRILLTTTWFGVLCTAVSALLGGWAWALGFALGALLGAVNLFLLGVLSRLILVTGPRNLSGILSIVTMKVVLIYGGLAGLLLWRLPPALAVVCGFSLVLAVITLKAAGRALLSSGVLNAPTRSAGRGKDG